MMLRIPKTKLGVSNEASIKMQDNYGPHEPMYMPSAGTFSRVLSQTNTREDNSCITNKQVLSKIFRRVHPASYFAPIHARSTLN